MSSSTRKRVYEVAIAAVLIAVAHGLIDGNEAQLWLTGLAAALGLARYNVPTDTGKTKPCVRTNGVRCPLHDVDHWRTRRPR